METTAPDLPKESVENVLPNNNTDEKTPSPPPQDPPSLQEQPKKSKKEDRMKKDDKNVEQFMKSLNSMPSMEDKFSMVCKKYVQTSEDNKKLQFYIKQSDKRYALLLKEKDQLQHEFNKTILVKSKLENLCRELQKQNKAIKEESLLKIREEEERRKETQAKFQNTLSEITTLLQQNNEKNAKLRDDNISMSEKFKSVVQQYQLREQQVDKMAKQMSLESQLSDAKLQKAGLEHKAEKERMLAEMEQLKVTIAQCRAKINEMQGTETVLKGQLAVYTDKYDEFQNALVKSNQVFGGFKEQMENMSKKIKKLEKESLSWKKRWETSQTALLDMCGERQASEERASAAQRQLQHMQSLCRTLQSERASLLAALKEHNIERPPLPPPAPAPPAPAPVPASNAKVDAMAANCAHLRQSLAHLQSQLNVLTNKGTNKEESPKSDKQKKSKSKKNKTDKSSQERVIEKSDLKESEASAVAIDDSKPCVDADKIQSELATDGQNETSNVAAQVTETVDPLNNDDKLTESIDNRVDERTLESLIQAISNANISLCDLDVGDVLENGEQSPKVIEINETVDNTNSEDSTKSDASVNKSSLNDSTAVDETNKNTKSSIIEIKAEVTHDSTEADASVGKPAEDIKDKKILTSSNEGLNNSHVEQSSNDEVAHIAETKPIALENA